MYEGALLLGADALAQETIEIADTAKLGVTRKIRSDGTEEVIEEDMLGHRQLQVKTRQWLASKLDRERYGERVKVDRGGTPLLDAALVGFAGALLERLARPQPYTETDVSPTTSIQQQPFIDPIEDPI